MFKQHYVQVTSSSEITESRKELQDICGIHFRMCSAAELHNLPSSFKKSLKSQQPITRAVGVCYLGHLAEKYKDALVIQYFVFLKRHFETLKIKKNLIHLSPTRNKPQRFREFCSNEHTKVLMDLYERHTAPLRHSDRYFHVV